MNIDGVKSGIVLDHIKAGKSMIVYDYLELSKLSCCVALIQNCQSKKMGLKDIVKIDELIDIDLDGQLIGKKHLALPETLKNVIKCKNPRCITSTEQELPHIFRLVDRENRIYRCIYCDAVGEANTI